MPSSFKLKSHFGKRYKWPKITQVQIENLNNNLKNESLLNSISKRKKTSGSDG